MSTTLPPPPPPPNPKVQRFTPDGLPTQAQVLFEKQLEAWLKSLAAAAGV